MLFRSPNRPHSGCFEGREKTQSDQESPDELDDPGEPHARGELDRLSSERPEELLCPVLREQEAGDDAQEYLDRWRELPEYLLHEYLPVYPPRVICDFAVLN